MGDGLIPGGHIGYLGPEGDGQAIGVSTLGNTAGQTGTTQGTYVLAGVGGVTLSQSTSPSAVATVFISGQTAQSQSHQPAVDAIGMTNSGNFAGNVGTITGTYLLVGSGAVTLSQSTSPTGGTLVINAVGGTGSGVGISANGSSQATGVVVFGDSNNVSFGMNGHTVTAVAPINFSAGTTSGTATAVTFDDANGVSFGFNAGTITASIGSGATATGNLGAITANGGAISSGTASLGNANGVSFGIAGQTITASAPLQVSAGTSSALVTAVTFSDSNGLAFGLNAGTITGSYTQSTHSHSTSPAAISANGGIITSGTASFANSNGVSFGINGQTVTASVATSLTNINVSAGTTSNNLSAVTFSNANGVSFGLNASTITASIATSLTNINVSAGTTSNNLSAVTFANSNGITFGLNASTVTASHAINVSAGTTSNNLSAITFANGSGVTFGLNASTVTASVAAGATATGNLGGIADSAGHTITNGTVVFSDGGTNTSGGNVTFGLSGSTMTASHNAVVSVGAQDFGGGAGINVGVPRWVFASSDASAGFNVAFTKSVNGVSGSILAHAKAVAIQDSAGTATSGTVSFGNSNGVSFGLVTSNNQMTASVGAGATATGNLGGIADSAQTATSGTVVFSNSNNITFGMSGSTRMTASFGGPQVAIAASAATITSGTVVLSNSAVEFGFNGSTITAQPKRVSYIVNNGYDRGVFLGDISVGTMWVAPFYIYAPISVTRCDFLCAISNSSSGAGSMVVRMGMYTLSQSTASLVFSAARSMSYNSTLGSNSSYTQVSGTRYRSINIAAVNLTPGEYMLAFMYQLTTGQTSGTYQAFGGRDVSIVGNEYPNALGTTQGAFWNGGFLSASTAAIPNSLHISDVVSTGSNDIVFVPFVTLAGTF